MLKPVFSSKAVEALDHTSKLSLALDGTKYLPGIVGLNNIKARGCGVQSLSYEICFLQANDYMNVILHALENVPPFRDYFLREENYAHIRPPPGDLSFILGT